MKTEKVSLTLPVELLDEARRRVRGASLSAYVGEGLRRQILADRQRELIAEWEAQFGAITAEELEQARQWLAD